MSRTRFGILVGAVLLGGWMVASAHAQDLNTLLAYFITDLRAGTFSIGASKDVVLSSNGSGVFKIAAAGSGSDEDLTIDGDTAANTITFASTTSVNKFSFSGTALADNFNTSAASGAAFQFNGKVIAINTAPTISSGFGTTPSIVANNGTAAFTINVGTGGTASTGVIGLPAATTGWHVDCQNTSTNTATVFVTKQTASTTTTATIGNYDAAGAAAAWVASNVLVCAAMAY